MKVYSYDPVAGKRGEQLYEIPLAHWTDQSVVYQAENGLIEPIPCKLPRSRKREDWTLHVDAGRGERSYLTDQWICFCLGKMGTHDFCFWDWIILPPKGEIKKVLTADG